MDDCRAIVVSGNADLQRRAAPRRSDEHDDVRIVGVEGSPMVSVRVMHVVVWDAVLAGACLDLHPLTLVADRPIRQHMLTEVAPRDAVDEAEPGVSWASPGI